MPDLDYLAGILDGEGCFSIRIHKGLTKNLGMRVRFQPQVVISNTDKKIISYIEEILNNYKIRYSKRLRHRNVKNAKNQWIIELMPTALRKLIPMLLKVNYFAKYREAQILLEALNLSQKHKADGFKGAWGRQPLTEETLKKFDVLRQELVSLHGRQAKSLIKLSAMDFKTDLNIVRKKLRNGWMITKPNIL